MLAEVKSETEDDPFVQLAAIILQFLSISNTCNKQLHSWSRLKI